MPIKWDDALGRYIDRLAREVQERCGLPWEDARQELWVYYLEELQGLDRPLVRVRLRDRALIRSREKACRRQPESLVSVELRRLENEPLSVVDPAHGSGSRDPDALPMPDGAWAAVSAVIADLPRRLAATARAIGHHDGDVDAARDALGISDARMRKRLQRIREFAAGKAGKDVTASRKPSITE